MGLLKRKKEEPEVAAKRVLEGTPIGDLVPRRRSLIVGQVVRMKTRPAHGIPTLVVRIEDGTGFATATFTGRRSIAGIELGRTLGIEGIPRCLDDKIEFTNPEYTLLER